MTVTKDIIAVAACFEPVAVRKIWMIGKLVFVLRAALTSPIKKRRTSIKTNERLPLIKMVCTRIFGMTVAAFRTSSLIWIAPSKPEEFISMYPLKN